MSSERNEFEREVREALRAEAEAGPDYRSVLHTRVMERVRAANALPAPSAPTSAPPPRLVMLALGAVILLLVVLAIIALTHGR